MGVSQRCIRLKEGLVMQYCYLQVSLNRTFSIACEGLHWVAYMYSTNFFFFSNGNEIMNSSFLLHDG